MASYPKKSAPVSPPAALSVVESAPAPAFESEPVLASFDAPAPVPPSVILNETAKAVEAPAAVLPVLQDKARSLIEKGIVESRANYAKAKAVANEASSAIEASVSAAKTGVVELNLKTIEAIKSGADANFEFLKSLFSAKSVSEYVTLHTEFARKRFEAATTHSKDFAALARKVADETVAPIKTQVAKSFKVAV